MTKQEIHADTGLTPGPEVDSPSDLRPAVTVSSTSPAATVPTRFGTDRIALALLVASLLAAFVFLVYVDQHMWFQADDFDFLTQRGLHGAALSIWFPHDVHWSTLPLLSWRAIFVFAKMRTARPYLVALYLTHLALAYVLWRLMRSVGTGPYVATALAAVFAVLGSGAENIIAAFQITFVSSLLLGWIVVMLLNHEGRAVGRDVAALVIAVAALMTSGVAVTMVVVAGITALARRGWRAAARIVAPCAAVYLVWFTLVGRHRRTLVPTQPFRTTLRDLPSYVVAGLGHSLSAATGSSVFGVVLFVALVVFAFASARLASGPAAPAFAGLIGTFVFFTVNAFGRDGLGTAEARRSRYVYVAVALLLPLIGLAVTAVVRRSRAAGAIGLVVLVLVGIWNVGQLLSYRDTAVAASLQGERQLIAAARIGATGWTDPGASPLDDLAPNPYPTEATLEQMYRAGDLPPGVTPTPADFVNAATEIQLEFTAAPKFGTTGVAVRPLPRGLRAATLPDGCTAYTSSADSAVLQVGAQSPVSLLVRPAAWLSGASIALVLVQRGVWGVRTRFDVSAADPWLDVRAAPAELDLFLGAGAVVTACGSPPAS